MALQDDFEYEQVFIISESKEEIREKEWDLLSVIMPEKIPCREDMHNWYNPCGIIVISTILNH